MSQETHIEDQTILAALVALEGGNPADPGVDGRRSPEGADEEAETLARLYREVLGLLPYELDPAAPRPEVKRRLMGLVEGEETQEVRGLAEAAPAVQPPQPAISPISPISATQPPAEAARPAAVPAPLPTPAPVPESVAPPRAYAPPPRRPASRWPLALAATLAVALLGLSGWLFLGWNQQRETIADLKQQVRDLSRKAREADRALQDSRVKRHDLQGNLRLVEVNMLRPAGDPPLQPDAKGILFVAPDHQHWFLSVENLQPPEPGKQYQLWFVAKNVPVNGGLLTAEPGESAQLSSAEMPSGITAAMVTLEDVGGAPTPSGPEVLRVADVYLL